MHSTMRRTGMPCGALYPPGNVSTEKIFPDHKKNFSQQIYLIFLNKIDLIKIKSYNSIILTSLHFFQIWLSRVFRTPLDFAAYCDQFPTKAVILKSRIMQPAL